MTRYSCLSSNSLQFLRRELVSLRLAGSSNPFCTSHIVPGAIPDPSTFLDPSLVVAERLVWSSDPQ